jgi:hypothetical protein
MKDLKYISMIFTFEERNLYKSTNVPDPVESVSFGWGQVGIRIHFRNH